MPTYERNWYAPALRRRPEHIYSMENVSRGYGTSIRLTIPALWQLPCKTFLLLVQWHAFCPLNALIDVSFMDGSRVNLVSVVLEIVAYRGVPET